MRTHDHVAVLAAAAFLLLAAGGGCGSDNGSLPTDGGAVPVASAEQLAGMLVTAGDLEGEWTPWERFAEWPGGKPGVIPEDQRPLLPRIEPCAEAGAAAAEAARKLTWQAFTQLHLKGADPAKNMVFVQEFLLAGDAAAIQSTFAALRDGMVACLGKQTETPDGEICTSQAAEVPAVGDDRIAERDLVDEPGGRATWDGRQALVRDGTVLMGVTVFEVMLGESTKLLGVDDLDAILTAAARKLP